MDTFYQVFGVVAALCAGIIILSNMAVFETEQGARIQVRAESIRMIEEVANAP